MDKVKCKCTRRKRYGVKAKFFHKDESIRHLYMFKSKQARFNGCRISRQQAPAVTSPFQRPNFLFNRLLPIDIRWLPEFYNLCHFAYHSTRFHYTFSILPKWLNISKSSFKLTVYSIYFPVIFFSTC